VKEFGRLDCSVENQELSIARRVVGANGDLADVSRDAGVGPHALDPAAVVLR